MIEVLIFCPFVTIHLVCKSDSLKEIHKTFCYFVNDFMKQIG